MEINDREMNKKNMQIPGDEHYDAFYRRLLAGVPPLEKLDKDGSTWIEKDLNIGNLKSRY